ncbi:MAG: hypothetical protein QM484_04980 [Woeseiaceae bacterium]
MRTIFSWLVLCIFILYSGISHAGGEHQRRFTVELALVAGDSRLLAFVKLSKEKRRWIKNRITGAINVLPLLARYSFQESGQTNPELVIKLHDLKKLLDAPEKKLYKAAQSLANKYQITFPLVLLQKLNSTSKNQIAKRYKKLCFGCHDVPSLESSVVIGGFASFSRSMSQEEWLARLLGGLHGDAYTGFENPFSDREVAMLFSYIREL